MNENQWLSNYFDRYRESIFSEKVNAQLLDFKNLVHQTQAEGRKVIFVGNGGSAAISSHCAVDFTKTAGIRAINFNESDLITCFANDYGYEHWVEKAIGSYADEGDLVVLISSSGKSPNMVCAGEYVVSKGLRLVTFTGFTADNPLRKLGEINFWVDSLSYNIVENTHLVWLLAVCDLIIAKNEPAKEQGETVVTRN